MAQEINSNEQSSNILESKSENKPDKIGTKYQVYNGLALRTSGGLCKEDLMENKRGLIISKKRHEQGHKAFENIRKYCGKKSENNEPKQEQKESDESEEKELKEIEHKQPVITNTDQVIKKKRNYKKCKREEN